MKLTKTKQTKTTHSCESFKIHLQTLHLPGIYQNTNISWTLIHTNTQISRLRSIYQFKPFSFNSWKLYLDVYVCLCVCVCPYLSIYTNTKLNIEGINLITNTFRGNCTRTEARFVLFFYRIDILGNAIFTKGKFQLVFVSISFSLTLSPSL